MKKGSDTLGYMAGTLTTLSFVPQVVQTFQTGKTGDLSFGMYLMITTGVALWFCYGCQKKDKPIILFNGVTFVLALSVLFMITKNLLSL